MRSKLSTNSLIQKMDFGHCKACPLIDIMKSSLVIRLQDSWRPCGGPSLQEVSSDSETWRFNTGTKQNSKEQEVEKTVCLVETPFCSPAFLQKQQSNESRCLPFGGVSPDGASPQKDIVNECDVPALLKSIIKASWGRNLRSCLPASITR